MTNTEIDPLRSFDLDIDDWNEVVAGVRKEGLEEWDAYAPPVAAAIIEGYLDNHLQSLGKMLRGRYLYLKGRGEAPFYAPNQVAEQDESRYPVRRGWGPRVITAVESGEYDMMPDSGIQPLYKAYASTNRSNFTAKGFTFDKSAFVGKHFVSPVPVSGGALYRIESIGRDKAQVVCIIANRLEGKEGRTYSFQLETQRYWYNLPPSV